MEKAEIYAKVQEVYKANKAKLLEQKTIKEAYTLYCTALEAAGIDIARWKDRMIAVNDNCETAFNEPESQNTDPEIDPRILSRLSIEDQADLKEGAKNRRAAMRTIDHYVVMTLSMMSWLIAYTEDELMQRGMAEQKHDIQVTLEIAEMTGDERDINDILDGPD